MTTNIYDKAAKTVAADSRWSIELSDGRLWYVDDTNYDKIHSTSQFVTLFAGDAVVINTWKAWLDSDGIDQMQSEMDLPATNDTSIGVIDIDSGLITFKRNTSNFVCPNDSYFFSGTGASHAYRCWTQNFCYTRAINTAMSRDLCTGGSVRYFHLDKKTGNVVQSTDLNLITEAIVERGYIMEVDSTGGTKAIPYRDLAANDPDINSLKDQLVSGSLRPSAPSHDSHVAWTTEERTNLFDALLKYKKTM